MRLFLFTILILFTSVCKSQIYDQDQNHIVLYNKNNINRIEVISIGHKVKIVHKNPDKLKSNKFVIDAIEKNYIVTNYKDTVSIADVIEIKNITLGYDNKREGYTIFGVGVACAAVFYGIDTYAPASAGTSLVLLVVGFTGLVTSTYGIVNAFIGTIKTNRWYDIKRDWNPSVEKRHFYEPGIPDVVK